MSYCDLIKQESEYTYSANIQFDIENDIKLLRFIPNKTNIELLKNYFIDMVKSRPLNHARILYGSYGTGKSHLLTVLCQLLGKNYTHGIAYDTFIDRIRHEDIALADDINNYINDVDRKPFLIVPIVFDFSDFERCIYFSLKKKLESLNINVQYKTFYDQAIRIVEQWKSNSESYYLLDKICIEHNIDLEILEKDLATYRKEGQAAFNVLFKSMTYGLDFIYEASSIAETINQVNTTISDSYSGIVFVFDEFGRYIEDNIKTVRVKSIQDLAEYCDHCLGNNHILLVSHKEISQYTQSYGTVLAAEWKKVEGRYRTYSINKQQSNCADMVKSVLRKELPVWESFCKKHNDSIKCVINKLANSSKLYALLAIQNCSFEDCFPLHPISLLTLDKLSKKVAQNDRTFFTFLASKDENSLFRFLVKSDLEEFHYVGVDLIFDYFLENIKSVQSDESFEWYKNYLHALNKNNSGEYDCTAEVKVLKVVATFGIINDSSILAANKETIIQAIDLPEDIVENALSNLCKKKILKYSATYSTYIFFDSSIYDVEAMIEEESYKISDESIVHTLNDHFINFVLYPHRYNRDYKIKRTFVPVFVLDTQSVNSSNISKITGNSDGVLFMLLSNRTVETECLAEFSKRVGNSIVWCIEDQGYIVGAVRKYIAAKYLETQKTKYNENDPTFEKELNYHIDSITTMIESYIDDWKRFKFFDGYVYLNGIFHSEISSIIQISELASKIMYEYYSDTLIVNNELINKNNVSGSIASAKKIALNTMIGGADENNCYGLQYLSPSYIAVRSVLAKNGLINTEDSCIENCVTDGHKPQNVLKKYMKSIIEQAKLGKVEFASVYATLKGSPYGLRDGYLSLLYGCLLLPYKKSLVISSHGTEQELSAELLEDIVQRPSDFSFTVATWSTEQSIFLDNLENLFVDYIDETSVLKNRVKAVSEAMMGHYKTISKYSRSTNIGVSNESIKYRRLLESSSSSYTDFVFNKLLSLTGDYSTAYEIISFCKNDLDNSLKRLHRNIKDVLLETFKLESSLDLAQALRMADTNVWSNKRKKVFDYYTNVFLEDVSLIQETSSEEDIVRKISKDVVGIELSYWSDKHFVEFENRIKSIEQAIASYNDSEELSENEIRMTLVTSCGDKKDIIFDGGKLSPLGQTVKNKINSTFNNFGLAVTYDDKVKILLSIINDMLEGK